MGPSAYYAQWTMERTIGNLGEEIKQPSNPYANLSQRGLRRAQVNALTASLPQFATASDSETLPLRRGVSVGDGYALLRPREPNAHLVYGAEKTAIKSYIEIAGKETLPAAWTLLIHRWGRLQLPNGQI